MKKQQRQKKVLIPSMHSANYSKFKKMSVGTVCIKRFKFACMTILSPETVLLVLCQWWHSGEFAGGTLANMFAGATVANSPECL